MQGCADKIDLAHLKKPRANLHLTYPRQLRSDSSLKQLLLHSITDTY